MSGTNPFAAELLESSASGFAGFAASMLLERDPGVNERFAPNAFSSWKSNLTQRVLELSAALAAGEPNMFVSRVVWSRKAFLASSRDEKDLHQSLRCLRDVLSENLPEAAAADALNYIDTTFKVLDEQPPVPDETELDPSREGDRLALQYLESVLDGNIAAAIDKVTAAAQGPLDTQRVYLEVLLPAQREIGRLWHLGDVNVAEEHLVSFATQRAMSILANRGDASVSNDQTMVAAAIAGNSHDIGLRAVTDLYQLEGWRTIFLGSDVPTQDLPSTLTFFGADLLLIAATLSTQVPTVHKAIREVRSRCERPVKIMVGGAAFDESPELWKKVGADGYADSVDRAVAMGASLVGQ